MIRLGPDPWRVAGAPVRSPAVRILHTSDWHVGRTIRGRSRTSEHHEVLAEIAGVAADKEVDLVLVAGDVFDAATPPPEAERIVYRALLDLADVAPVVMVARQPRPPSPSQAVCRSSSWAGSRSVPSLSALRPAG